MSGKDVRVLFVGVQILAGLLDGARPKVRALAVVLDVALTEAES